MAEADDTGWHTVSRNNRQRGGINQHRFDIATDREFKKENLLETTTYFFTNFPERYGAKALFNAFHNHGYVMEVVIPAKRDQGGRIFGYARFARVVDPNFLESSLDNIIFGCNKISVNLSRFHRKDNMRSSFNKSRNGPHIPLPNAQPHPSTNLGAEIKSYAQVVKRGGNTRIGEGRNRTILSYEAEKQVLQKLKKAFVGEVKQPGMTYNVQNEFHMQGYFGVKVTPLGSTLTLLEEQEEGEVQALMVDAKEWLDQWFQEIHPWSPKEIDRDRIVWLRVYCIPVHAWNDQFFTQITKPWGTFINTDDVTSKKLSMDVARLMIRTSCQIVVDEFFDVKINGEFFHLRILEDSYGPMRIPLPQSQSKSVKVNPEDEDEEEDEEEEEEEEEERRLMMGEEDQERESEGEGENLSAFNPHVNTHNESINNSDSNIEIIKDKEIREEDSLNSNNDVLILNQPVMILNQVGGP
jgi:hypothetical protein